MHWRGKAEVQKAHQVFFDLLFKNRSCNLDEIESIEPLPAALSSRSCAGRWAAIDGQAGQ
jgi:hypothetical protein